MRTYKGFISPIFPGITDVPALVPLYGAVYQKGDRSYWARLDEEMRPFEDPPIVVNYFFHEEMIATALFCLRRRFYKI